MSIKDDVIENKEKIINIVHLIYGIIISRSNAFTKKY